MKIFLTSSFFGAHLSLSFSDRRWCGSVVEAQAHQQVTVKCWRMQVAAVVAEVLDKQTLAQSIFVWTEGVTQNRLWTWVTAAHGYCSCPTTPSVSSIHRWMHPHRSLQPSGARKSINNGTEVLMERPTSLQCVRWVCGSLGTFSSCSKEKFTEAESALLHALITFNPHVLLPNRASLTLQTLCFLSMNHQQMPVLLAVCSSSLFLALCDCVWCRTGICW